MIGNSGLYPGGGHTVINTRIEKAISLHSDDCSIRVYLYTALMMTVLLEYICECLQKNFAFTDLM